MFGEGGGGVKGTIGPLVSLATSYLFKGGRQ